MFGIIISSRAELLFYFNKILNIEQTEFIWFGTIYVHLYLTGGLNRNMRSLLFTIFSNFFSGLCRDILKFCILWLWRQIEIVTNTKVAYGGERGAPLGAGKECQVGFLLIRLFSPNYQLQHLILSSRISPHSPLSRISPHLPFFSELSASTSYFCHLWIWEAKRKNGHRVKYLQTNLVYSGETLVFFG